MFDPFEKFVALLFGAIAAIYSAVLLAGLCAQSRLPACDANVALLAFVAFAAFAFIARKSRGQGGLIVGLVLLLLTASGLSKNRQHEGPGVDGQGHGEPTEAAAYSANHPISAAFR